MKRKSILILVLFALVFNLTSCKVSKQYVQYVSKKEDIKKTETKSIVLFATKDLIVNEFTKTFDKNFASKRDFITSFMNDFSKESQVNNLFYDVLVDDLNSSYENVNKQNTDYIIRFSNIEITNRVEWRNSGGMNMNGMGMQAPTSSEYCVINVKVEVYDAKTDKEIIDFISIGEDAVFLFSYTKALKEAKKRAVTHIINYLKTGRTTYEKY